MLEIKKYITQRIGLLSMVSAICEDSKHGSVVLPVGNMEIAPSKRKVVAITHFGEDLGTWNNCKEAKNCLVNKFEERAKYRQKLAEKEVEIPFEKLAEKEVEKGIDNINSKVYNKEVAKDTATTNKTKESVDMKKSNVAGTKVVGNVANVKVVSKIKAKSKTRGTEETMKVTFFPTYAQVNSGSGSKYIVTKESCTCPDHCHRGHDKLDEQGNVIKTATICRHRTAVSDVLTKMKNDVKYW